VLTKLALELHFCHILVAVGEVFILSAQNPNADGRSKRQVKWQIKFCLQGRVKPAVRPHSKAFYQHSAGLVSFAH
jgi:hypothetical protein